MTRICSPASHLQRQGFRPAVLRICPHKPQAGDGKLQPAASRAPAWTPGQQLESAARVRFGRAEEPEPVEPPLPFRREASDYSFLKATCHRTHRGVVIQLPCHLANWCRRAGRLGGCLCHTLLIAPAASAALATEGQALVIIGLQAGARE